MARTRKKGRPYLKLDPQCHNDSKVRRARAGAAWPWVLCRLKHGMGTCADEEIDHELLALDLNIPEDLAEEQLAGLQRVGLLVRAAPEHAPEGYPPDSHPGLEGYLDSTRWTTPRFWDFQDLPSTFRTREHRKRKRKGTVPDGSERPETQEGSGEDRSGEDRSGAAGGAREPAQTEWPDGPTPPPEEMPDHPEGFQGVLEAWIQNAGGHFVPPLVQRKLALLAGRASSAEVVKAINYFTGRGKRNPHVDWIAERVEGKGRTERKEAPGWTTLKTL